MGGRLSGRWDAAIGTFLESNLTLSVRRLGNVSDPPTQQFPLPGIYLEDI